MSIKFSRSACNPSFHKLLAVKGLQSHLSRDTRMTGALDNVICEHLTEKEKKNVIRNEHVIMGVIGCRQTYDVEVSIKPYVFVFSIHVPTGNYEPNHNNGQTSNLYHVCCFFGS